MIAENAQLSHFSRSQPQNSLTFHMWILVQWKNKEFAEKNVTKT